MVTELRTEFGILLRLPIDSNKTSTVLSSALKNSKLNRFWETGHLFLRLKIFLALTQ